VAVDGSVGQARAEWSGPPSADAVADVHRQACRVMQDWQLRTDVAEDAALVIAELLANVVQHARTAFRLAIRLRGNLLHVAVDDGSTSPPPPGTDHPTTGQLTGLRLVNAVALRWGWQERPTGKTVWAEFAS
jgi:anti-sigma regulatory factor (Ser/Thr protein kinase)